MDKKVIKTVCICGAGTMGSGIAQAAAQAGFSATLYEVNAETLQKAESAIRASLDQLKAKGKISAENEKEILQRLTFTTAFNEFISDIIIEAIIEKEEPKIALFNSLAEINGAETIFATNTSSLSIEKIASRVSHPERVVGMHFFNPATIMKLVEVIRCDFTSAEVIELVSDFAKRMGKIAVQCRDSPGFIVNRVARPYYIEALRLIEEELITTEKMDELLEATGFRLGPFKLMDLIGNDVNFAVSCSVYEQLGKPIRLKPSYLQEQNVKDGRLGRKTGQGFYNY
jgi:3-hydroxybutyryl-CoA dehydrogenase